MQQAAVAAGEIRLDGRIRMLTGSCPNRTFSLMGDDRTVQTGAATVYSGLTCDDLRNNRDVQVTGVVQPNGNLLAILVVGGGGD